MNEADPDVFENARITQSEIKGLVPKRAPTAPERTISGGQPINPTIVKALVNQQSAADKMLAALHDLGEAVARRCAHH